jgi:hypothetical protein
MHASERTEGRTINSRRVVAGLLAERPGWTVGLAGGRQQALAKEKKKGGEVRKVRLDQGHKHPGVDLDQRRPPRASGGPRVS